MNSEEYLKMIAQTFRPDTDQHVLYCMVGLAGEAGEVANMAQKLMRGDFSVAELMEYCSDPDKISETQRAKLLGELGGVFYFLHALCWQLHIRPEIVMGLNADKLRSRLARGTIRGDGDER